MPMSFIGATGGGNCDECEWIAAEGTIERNTPAKFRKFLESSPGGSRIHFNSPGGNLQAALELGEIIRQRGYLTEVDKTVGSLEDGGFVYAGREPDTFKPRQSVGCRSACIYAFIGGANRTANDGDIWIHQFFDPIAVSDFLGKTSSGFQRAQDQALSGRLISYLTRMGVSTELLSRASQVSPTDPMYNLTKDELVELRVDNSMPFYTSLDVKADTNGAFVETINKSTYRDFVTRIYCSGNLRQPRIQVLVRSEDVSDYDYFDRISSTIDQATLKNGNSERPFSVKRANWNPNKAANKIAFSLAVVGATMSDIESADEIAFEGGGVRHEWEEVHRLSFKLKGDKRKIGIVARNCFP
jgi:hypothetical protein